MEEYIKQLIEQLHDSIKKVPLPSERSQDFDLEDEGELEDFQYVEQYIYGKEEPLSKIFGIERDFLPDESKLNDAQVKLLAYEIEKLWKVYHFYPVLPDNLPPRLRYRTLRDHWDKEQVFVGVGEIHIEFCDYEEAFCPFPGYCNICKEIEAQMEYDKRYEPDENDYTMRFELNNLIPSKEEVKNCVLYTKKQRIKKSILNSFSENNIPEIYNFCDRWCEKCDFTSQCSAYLIEQEISLKDHEYDINNEEYWKNLSLMFEATIELLREKMKEMNIQPSDMSNEYTTDERKSKEHPLLKLAGEYGKDVHNWMESKKESLNTYLAAFYENGKEHTLREAIMVITWYQYFISAKIHRALGGLLKNKEDETITYDMNGSAKIALIAIERSIGAWGILLQQCNKLEDDIFRFISFLNQLRVQSRHLFPDAETFIRPGFDER